MTNAPKEYSEVTMTSEDPSFLFDLDGTLVDSVYQHVLAWRSALAEEGIELSVWRIHRRIGMSGGLLTNALLRVIGRPVGAGQVERLQHRSEERRVGKEVVDKCRVRWA